MKLLQQAAQLLYINIFIGAIAIGLTAALLQYIARTVKKAIKPSSEAFGVNNLGIIVSGFLCFGLSLGILSAGSRQPIMQAVVPAILTFYGGIVSYVFYNKDYNNTYNRIVGILSLMLISAGMAIGAGEASRIRAIAEYDEQNNNTYFEMEKEKFKSSLKVYEWQEQKRLGIQTK